MAKLKTKLDQLEAVRSAALETLEEDQGRRDDLVRIQRGLEIKCKEALQQVMRCRDWIEVPLQKGLLVNHR